MDVTINIKKKYIRRGIIGHHFRCPIARSISDVVRPDVRVAVTIGTISLWKDGGYNRYGGVMPRLLDMKIPTPPKVDAFVRRFDKGRDLPPFRFTLNLPDEVLANA